MSIEILYIIGAVQGFFFSGLLWNKSSKSFGDYVMLTWFLLLTILLAAYSLEVMGIEDQYPLFWSLNTSLPMLVGPITLLYVLAYTKRDPRIRPSFVLHALPYMAFTVLVCIKMFVSPENTTRATITHIEDGRDPLFFLFEQIRIVIGPMYLMAALILLRKHGERIHHYFSYTENIDLRWIRNLIRMSVLIWVTVIVMNILSNWNTWIPWRWGDNIIYLTVTVTIFANGYYGIKQQIIFSPATEGKPKPAIHPPKEETSLEPEATPTQYLKSSLTDQASKQLLEALLSYMEEEKPYLDGKLSLTQVAEELGISANHLSQVINSQLGKNFFDFINGYRVALMKEKLQDPANQHLTLLGLAYACGFNSKSSFNHIFKKMTGLTPSQFKKAKGA
ncbi:MAG TPA: hypothetical protein DCE41_23200 [Cytophagales bacterium]|nr:hypothetical protein [Cytophagales bacterium]HAA21764.1 hypothetical protein [Cytophagales bacterium]HAP60076.1 hypothetical protein [Cytophagales bacterium]